jgi:hypothetical protein
MATELHFAEDTFALHLLLQGAERLINVIFANEDLHVLTCFSRLDLSVSSAAHKGRCGQESGV